MQTEVQNNSEVFPSLIHPKNKFTVIFPKTNSWMDIFPNDKFTECQITRMTIFWKLISSQNQNKANTKSVILTSNVFNSYSWESYFEIC